MSNKAAQQLGRLGGKVSSEAKAAAARANGAKGGRPKMSGQEKWTNGNELRWVIGGEAATVLHRDTVVYDGTYDGAVQWLKNRGNSPV